MKSDLKEQLVRDVFDSIKAERKREAQRKWRIAWKIATIVFGIVVAIGALSLVVEAMMEGEYQQFLTAIVMGIVAALLLSNGIEALS